MAMPPPSAVQHSHTNRLAQTTSPYLLQHAHNPVDWYPWGAEAIEAARAQDKPIFLSVGYSTCYWCHVMERQCFENEAIAAEMNDKFICIKVDREERPDVDQLYMTAVQVLTRQGGWPMSVFLTPALKPFFGGTYFPPEDGHGRPGFPRVLNSISAAYHTKREQVERSADEIVRVLQKVAQPRQPTEPLRVDVTWVESLIERATADYEQCFGGFGGAPKFPRQTLLEMLLAYTGMPGATEDAEQIRAQVLYTLDYMAEGGIRDQLGGGFHRYSTDEKWLVPHFEIMLYDNAMLAVVYVEAWRQTQNPNYAKVARGILDFVLREMTGPQGAFYTAFDAEVDAQEGLTYLWTPDEVRTILAEFAKEDVELFSRVYGLAGGPNFADPHHGTGQPDKNILFLPTPLANVAKSLNVSEEQLDARLEPMRQALYAARRKRKQPLLDTKILTSWNALTIRAFAVAGQALHETRYTAAAVKAAQFLLDQHRMADGSLIRTSRPDAKAGAQNSNLKSEIANLKSHISNLKSEISDLKSQIPGFLDDYAFLTQALLALHRATGDIEWRHRALRVAETMNDKFRDRELGGFFFTAADATDLIVRQKTASDSPLPSGNAVAALALAELGAADTARQVLAVFAQSLEDQAEGMSSMVQAALEYLKANEPFTVSTDQQSAGNHPPTPDQLAKSAVELSAQWASPTELRVHVKVLDTFHLNANRAAQGMIPTTLALAGPRGAAVAAHVDYPPGEERQFAFAGEAIRVYDGEVTIAVQLDQTLPAGTKLRAALTYQACTEDACLSATTQAIDLTAP
jgi:uncharacterized protein YyaL (SSP411 family)